MMATNLNEAKEDLMKMFNKLIKKANEKIDSGYTETSAQLVMAASEAAKAMALIEREQCEAKERGYNKLDKN